MKIARLAGLMFVAVLALGLVAVSAAFAGPQFNPTSGVTLSGSGGTGLLKANNGAETVLCTANSASGVISSATLAGGVVVKFTGCTSTSTEKANCSVSSKTAGGAAGTITTETLHGVLGTILPGGTAGLLLLPSAAGSKKFLTLLANKCTIEAQITGNVAGVIEPLGHSQSTGKLIFTTKAAGTEQAVMNFDPSTGGAVLPQLIAFGTNATEETTENLKFSPNLEVT
jgi:hypothetical protein